MNIEYKLTKSAILMSTCSCLKTGKATSNWNLRFLRQSASAPAGKPDLLFEVPSVIGYCKQGVAVQESDIYIATAILGINHHPVYKNKEMHQLLICYVHIHNLKPARDAESGINMYVKLLRHLELDNFLV